jgi:hypothetical protein
MGSREDRRIVRQGDPVRWAGIRQRALPRLWLMLPLAHTEGFLVCLCRGLLLMQTQTTMTMTR